MGSSVHGNIIAIIPCFCCIYNKNCPANIYSLATKEHNYEVEEKKYLLGSVVHFHIHEEKTKTK